MDFELDQDLSSLKKNMNSAKDEKSIPSPLRMQYAAETKIFRDQYGGLENIRQNLGFSRRKMCQLLLVDPSAWTRWTRDESKVPPHIYRALEWFLALNQKALTQPDLAAVFTHRYQIQKSQNSSDQSLLLLEIQGLKEELLRQKRVAACLTAGFVALLLTFALWALF